jgi:hypothetical protein
MTCKFALTVIDVCFAALKNINAPQLVVLSAVRLPVDQAFPLVAIVDISTNGLYWNAI